MDILQQISDTLYYGTTDTIFSIDVSKGRSNKEFGKGFYMAVEKSQAIGMMNKKFNEAMRRTKSKDLHRFSKHLYEIKLKKELLPTLKIKYFTSADMEWLDFVLLCRNSKAILHTYDLVIGTAADDNTILYLKYYFDGMYGKVGSDNAKEILMHNFTVEHTGMQYYIGKQEVADKLIASITELSSMTEGKIETTKGHCAVALTRYIMEKFNLPPDKAFATLASTELFGLLNDTETNLFMETNDYLCEACDFELNGTIDDMYFFIQNN